MWEDNVSIASLLFLEAVVLMLDWTWMTPFIHRERSGISKSAGKYMPSPNPIFSWCKIPLTINLESGMSEEEEIKGEKLEKTAATEEAEKCFSSL